MNTCDYSRIGRRLALALLAAAPLFGQCPTGTLYPGALDTNTSLTVAKNNIVTTLTVQQQVTDTVLIVTSTTGWAANMMATVDTGTAVEYEYVGSVVGMNTLNVTRACESSVAVIHLAGVSVANVATAYSGHTSIAGASIAIETALGANLANIPGTGSGPTIPINKGGTGQTTQTAALNAILGTAGVAGVQGNGDTKVQLAGTNSGTLGAPLCNDANGGTTTAACNTALPVATSQLQYLRIQPNTTNLTTYQFNAIPTLSATDYNFPAQTPGGSLSIGSNTVSLAPCPLGVNGTDANHFLYVSGGVGTAEAVPITSGSCVSGAVSGTVSVTAANTHSGAWTIQSATAGIQEGIVAAGSGNTLYIPPGTYTVFAASRPLIGTTLAGAGQGATTIKIANNALTQTQPWRSVGNALLYCVICLENDKIHLQDFTVDGNGTNQTWFYYGDISGFNATNAIIERVTVQNHVISGGTGVGFQFLGHTPLTSNFNNVIIDARNIGIPNCVVPNGGGAYYIEGQNNRVLSSYASSMCDVAYVISFCDHCSVIGSMADLGTGQMGTATFGIEGATNTILADNQCNATGTNGMLNCYSVGNAATLQTNGSLLINNSASHTFTGILVGAIQNSDTNPVLNTTIMGFHYDNSTGGNGITVNPYVFGLRMEGLDIQSPGANGVNINSQGTATVAPCPCVVQNVSLVNSKIDHAVTAGFLSDNNTAGPSVTGLTITDNFIGDTAAIPRQPKGIWIGIGAINNAYIGGNTLVGNTTNSIFQQGTWNSSDIIMPNVASDLYNGGSILPLGAAIASAATIAPITPFTHITGTAAIATITPPLQAFGGISCLGLIPDGAFTTTTGGNIALASTAVVNKVLTMCFDATPAKWYPSY